MKVRSRSFHWTARRLGQMGSALVTVWCSTLIASDFEGFTEPYRNIEVAAADSGTVAEIGVREGDVVKVDQALGHLNLDVLTATLEIADRSRNAVGKLKSAEAELRLKSERLEKLLVLLERKHASQEEVDRTQIEREVAEAQLLAVREELAVRELEYARIQHQINQRVFRSPIDGVVIRIYKDQGEFVAPTDPVVMNVVQLDPLTCVFSVPSTIASGLQTEAVVSLQISEARLPVKGTIEFVSPVTDAQSGTVKVKVRLSNESQLYRSGDKCWLQLPGAANPDQRVNAPATNGDRSASRPAVPGR